MLTKHIIVNEIANDKEYKTLCRKLSPKFSDDLYQDLMLILLRYNEVKLIEIYNKNQLKFFIVKILMNQAHSSSSEFYKLYRKQADYKEVDWYGDNSTNEDIIPATISTIELYAQADENNWYRAKLFKEYLKAGNIRALSKKTRIPVMSIQRSLAEFKHDIKHLVNENTFSTSI